MTGRGLALTAALALLTAGAGGCAGFTPLYAEKGVVEKLGHTQIDVADGRLAFLMRQSLEDALARDRQEAPQYRLAITFAEHRYPRGLRLNDTATSYELDVDVNYTLVDLKTGAVLMQKYTPVTVTYAATNQPYAGIIAQEDSQNRAAQQAAQLIKTDVATFFAGQQ
ncbi:LPS assembly lipoprotein LptE [Caulobacter sp. 17J80-11]|uniref:LPS assembly lipoprotein LptE n=1 Tax=Caulobacter sp. 17J80-11 TaxID=2763502 RepID=UPI001653C32B|nr:LPS assembly lipoprotein LptE [Caulobacter sp. 17J80-11]MBC6983364.1 hypothetical protein [Caulobacter sp. 17J80-11]